MILRNTKIENSVRNGVRVQVSRCVIQTLNDTREYFEQFLVCNTQLRDVHWSIRRAVHDITINLVHR